MDQTMGSRMAQQQTMSKILKTSRHVLQLLFPSFNVSTTIIATFTITCKGKTTIMMRLSFSPRKGLMKDQPVPIKRITTNKQIPFMVKKK
mmetsp:Transcript_63199/g.112779  ORF Transcript_63199/g.112779 Transcript_63199/m.112779 type:complete len:90 (-) Transcript_63199:739-1008(-)